MMTTPLASDSLIIWATHYQSQWIFHFVALLITALLVFAYFLWGLFKENAVDIAGQVLWILGEMGLKTQNPDIGEAEFERSAIDSMISNLINARSQKEGFSVSATSLGDGLPCVAPTGLNRMSSGHRESLLESHNVEQCISTSGEKLP